MSTLIAHADTWVQKPMVTARPVCCKQNFSLLASLQQLIQRTFAISWGGLIDEADDVLDLFSKDCAVPSRLGTSFEHCIEKSTMDFKDLYRFVGPPMTRGPPSLPLIPSLFFPPVVPSPKLLPPALPRPRSSCSRKTQKQGLRLKPHHRLKPSQRHLGSQVRPHVQSVIGFYKGLKYNTREMQMETSDLKLEYRTAKKDWLDYVEADSSTGDSQTIWTTVLDICPQFLTLDSAVGKYY